MFDVGYFPPTTLPGEVNGAAHRRQRRQAAGSTAELVA